MRIVFGTDGIRGLANKFLTPEIALITGEVFGDFLKKNKKTNSILLGKDSRVSGDLLMNALASGLMSKGVEVSFIELANTAEIALLVNRKKFDAGVMVSASHNPMPDNGIKIFLDGGKKLTSKQEKMLENAINKKISFPKMPSVNKILTGKSVGTYKKVNKLHEDYLKILGNEFDNFKKKLKVVVDCANGSSSFLAPMFYKKLGIEIIAINNNPNGININYRSGVNDLIPLKNKVLETKADLGIAHDGDADRCVAVDEKGEIVDGDILMALLALNMQKNNKLNKNSIVVTVMTNSGLLSSLNDLGINTIISDVGDKNVSKLMYENDLNFGGEQSGHIIFSDFLSVGDGLFTAAKLFEYLSAEMMPLSELTKQFVLYPQILLNIKTKNKNKILNNPSIKKVIDDAALDLVGKGRILVRASGTEDLVRVMVESPDEKKSKNLAEYIAKTIL